MNVVRNLVASFGLALLLIAPTTAGAHAFLDHSDPAVGSTLSAPPAVMHLWFTQELEPAFSWVTVTDKSGATVSDGPATVDPGNRSEFDVKLKPLAAGSYKVKWHALSVDTHTTEGDYTFSVRGK